MDIDFLVLGPDGSVLRQEKGQNEGFSVIDVTKPGEYIITFSNEFSTVTGKFVTFAHHATLQTEDEIIKEQHLQPLEAQVDRIQQKAQALINEQSYVRSREQAHRNTAESTNTRVMWASIIQSMVVVVVTAGQVIFIHRLYVLFVFSCAFIFLNILSL